MANRSIIGIAGFVLLVCGAANATAPGPSVGFLTYADVESLPGIAALPVFAGVLAPARPAVWDAWVRERAADVRARLLRGEEDSLAYWLVFGTSYTAAPRVTREFTAAPSASLEESFNTRLQDCLRAIAAPGTDERRRWAAATLARLGYRLDSSDGRTRAAEYMLRNLSRVIHESTELSQAINDAQRAGNRDAELSQRASLFAHRGLAPDTSWPINFALSEAFQPLKDSSTLTAGSVRRLAIVGPGLDFVDKDEGYDYCPPQSLQPFAVIDALVRSGLAGADPPAVTTVDISSRVNDHLKRLIGPAGRRPFDLQIIRNRGVEWMPGASRYWTEFGAAVGTSVAPISPPPSAGALDARAIRISLDVLHRISPIEANIIFQRINPAAGERFDLVIATNVLIYYDPFEQMLGAANIAHMLAPGGLLLTNTKLDDVPAFPMTRVAATATAFSSRPGDGEYVYVYRKAR